MAKKTERMKRFRNPDKTKNSGWEDWGPWFYVDPKTGMPLFTAEVGEATLHFDPCMVKLGAETEEREATAAQKVVIRTLGKPLEEQLAFKPGVWSPPNKGRVAVAVG